MDLPSEITRKDSCHQKNVLAVHSDLVLNVLKDSL